MQTGITKIPSACRCYCEERLTFTVNVWPLLMFTSVEYGL
jgi:hypothetical protein